MPDSIRAELIVFLYSIPCILIAIPFHGVVSAFVASKLGDPTAKNLGYMSMNPLKHFDPIGAILMLLFRFGWARPVPINTRNFRKPRRDAILVNLAGPAANLFLGFVGLLLHRILDFVFSLSAANLDHESVAVTVMGVILLFLQIFVQMNISFAVFYLLPIPPLAGARILTVILPPKATMAYLRAERYITLVMIILLLLGILSYPLTLLVNLIIKGMSFLIGLIPFL